MKVAFLALSFAILAVSTVLAEASHKKHKSKGSKSMDFPTLSPGMFTGDLPSDLQNAAGSFSKQTENSEDGEQGLDGDSEVSKHHRKSSHRGRRN